MYYKLQNVNGYQGAKLRIYQDFMDTFTWTSYGFPKAYLGMRDGRPEPRRPENISPAEYQANQAFLKMMNIRYIVSPYNLTDMDTTLTLAHAPEYQGANGVFEFSNFLERAHYVDEVVQVEGGEAALRFMAGGGFDPALTAVVEMKPPFEVSGGSENRVKITDYGLQHIEMATEVRKPAFLFMSEMYYPRGWKAWADGEETEIVKTNFAFRGLFLRPGVKTVRLAFEPSAVRAGLGISLATLTILLIGIATGLLFEKKRRSEEGAGTG
jgi:hypothetical protein